jgi:hypothetical protein
MDWVATVTAVGTVFGGLALPIAFIQLGALRSEQQRAQVNQLGVWTDDGDSSPDLPESPCWPVRLLMRNSSSLPLLIDFAAVTVRPYKYDNDGNKRLVVPSPLFFEPGLIAPGQTWTDTVACTRGAGDSHPPSFSEALVYVTDAAGRQWVVRPHKAGAARRVRWWLRNSRKREDDV